MRSVIVAAAVAALAAAESLDYAKVHLVRSKGALRRLNALRACRRLRGREPGPSVDCGSRLSWPGT